MLNSAGETAGVFAILSASLRALLGIVPFAAAIAGYGMAPLSTAHRVLLFISAGLLLWPSSIELAGLPVGATVGVLLMGFVAWAHRRG